MYDVERLLARVTHRPGQSARPELSGPHAAHSLPAVKAKLTARRSKLLGELEAAIDLCPELRATLEAALADECPLASREGGFIRDGFQRRARRAARAGPRRQAVDRPLPGARDQRTGIPSLKVGFNKVFGYYIEITNAHREKIPADYIRKQTIKNAERYITPELKEYEEKVLTADEKAKELEYELFLELRDVVAADRRRMQATAAVLAQIDVLAALAELARQRNYCRPEMVDEPVLQIVDGRHPVLDVVEPEGKFVPNDRDGLGRNLSDARQRFDPADHRPEHGRQEHVHPAGGAADADGADRQLRAGSARRRSAWPTGFSPASGPATSWPAAKARSWSR